LCCAADGGETRQALAEAFDVPPPEVVRVGEQFTVTVSRRKGEPFGLDLDLLDGRTAQILEIRAGGAVGRHSTRELPSRRVQPGDFIVSANGVEGDSQLLLQALKAREVATVGISRPVPFRVTVQRASSAEGFGVVLKSAARSGRFSLVVEEIRSGPVAEWNEEHPEVAVRRLDRIVEVNGVEHNTAQMLRSFEEELSLALCVVRPLDGDHGSREEAYAS